MKRSNPTSSERVLEVLWSAWSEMGVAGWRGRPFPLTIDPEALVLWTGCVGDEDARLRDEALDWCVRYSSLISRSRLQQMRAPPLARRLWRADYVLAFARTRWICTSC